MQPPLFPIRVLPKCAQFTLQVGRNASQLASLPARQPSGQRAASGPPTALNFLPPFAQRRPWRPTRTIAQTGPPIVLVSRPPARPLASQPASPPACLSACLSVCLAVKLGAPLAAQWFPSRCFLFSVAFCPDYPQAAPPSPPLLAPFPSFQVALFPVPFGPLLAFRLTKSRPSRAAFCW